MKICGEWRALYLHGGELLASRPHNPIDFYGLLREYLYFYFFTYLRDILYILAYVYGYMYIYIYIMNDKTYPMIHTVYVSTLICPLKMTESVVYLLTYVVTEVKF
jgi:hypothetical protein